MLRVAWLLVPALLAASCLSLGDGDQPTIETKESVNDLLLEVDALQMFRLLNLTREQLTHLRTLAKQTAQQLPAKPVEGKAGPEVRKTLQAFRDALVADKDDDRIDELSEKLAALRQGEKEPL